MHNYHDVGFIWISLPLSFLLLLFSLVLKQKKKLPIPGIDRLLFLLCVFQIILGIGITEIDNYFFREEIRNIEPFRIKSVTIIKGQKRIEMKNDRHIEKLISIVQSVRRIPSHHSRPTTPLKLVFSYGSDLYSYSLHRDSKNREEYWVFADRLKESGRRNVEIGRFVSRELETLIEKACLQSGE